MKRFDFYKRLYYMLVLMSIKIVLLSAQSCTYDRFRDDCIRDYETIFTYCRLGNNKNCEFEFKNCQETLDKGENICPFLKVKGDNMKCMHL